MPTTEHWPHTFVEMRVNRKGQTVYNFAPTQVTIKRIFEPKLDGSTMQYATGWSFNEDTTPSGQYTGVIWSHSGQWGGRGTPQEGQVTGPYPGPKGHVGAAATVSLSVTEADGRNFYNLNSITIQSEGSVDAGAPSTPAQASGASPANLAQADPIQARISKGQALSIRATVLAGLVQATEKRLEAMDVTPGQLAERLAVLERAVLVLDSGRQPTEDELYAIQPETVEPEETQVEEPPEEEDEAPW